MAADFPGLPILNRGFGGSTLADVVYYEDRILLSYHPRLVVLYAGDNDIEMGRSPERVARDYRAFDAKLRSGSPRARLVFVSIKPSPARWAVIDRARETNRLIRAEVPRDSLASSVDVFTPMLDPTGQPRPELFLPDSLHMNRAGICFGARVLRRSCIERHSYDGSFPPAITRIHESGSRFDDSTPVRTS